jgi:hypothetical protein
MFFSLTVNYRLVIFICKYCGYVGIVPEESYKKYHLMKEDKDAFECWLCGAATHEPMRKVYPPPTIV